MHYIHGGNFDSPRVSNIGYRLDIVLNLTEKKLYFDDCEEDDSGSEEEFENEDEDDEDGWITPANIGAKKKAMGLEFESGTQEQVDVACMTSDFAMQNVLIQVSNFNWMAITIIRFIKLLGIKLLVNDSFVKSHGSSIARALPKLRPLKLK